MKIFDANTIINYHISVIANQALEYRAPLFVFPRFFLDMTLNTTTKGSWGAAWRAESCKAAAAVTPVGALLLDKGMLVN